VPKVLINGRSAHEMIISKAHSLLTHLGVAKTISYLQDHVWWKDMVSDTKAFLQYLHDLQEEQALK
jgi:Integrase zinc binding domain